MLIDVDSVFKSSLRDDFRSSVLKADKTFQCTAPSKMKNRSFNGQYNN